MCLILAMLSAVGHAAEEGSYELAFSTYIGGEHWEHARDICTDSDGNVYVVGGTAVKERETISVTWRSRAAKDRLATAYCPTRRLSSWPARH